MYRTRTLVLVVLCLSVTEIMPHIAGDMFGLPRDLARRYLPSDIEEEYIRHIHSMINAYRSDTPGDRLVIETNSLVDTKYKTWKRNADIINSLLALPKGMNDAGR